MGVGAQPVDDFLDRLGFRLKITGEFDKFLARRFNVFQLYIRPDENKLSDVVGDLLDPVGPHGQGDTFLRHFLRIVGKSDTFHVHGARVCRENPTVYSASPKRRIDIALGSGSSCGIGIENKPWAPERAGWVKDYSDHLRGRFGDFVLAFLTLDGRQPGLEADQRVAKDLGGRFVTISYRLDLRNWLESCYRDCESDRVRRFLKDFTEYVQSMEGHTMADEYESAIVRDYLLHHPESLNVAHSVVQEWNEVVRSLSLEFLNGLRSELLQRLGAGYTVPVMPTRETIPKANWGNNPGGFRVSKPQWANHAITICPEASNCGALGLGVSKDGPDVHPIPGLFDALQNVRNGRPYDYWEWWFTLDQFRNWSEPGNMRALMDNTAQAYFVDWITRIASTAAPLLDKYYAH